MSRGRFVGVDEGICLCLADEWPAIDFNKNGAMVIVKPTANASAKSKEVIRKYLEKHGVMIKSEGAISASEIRAKGT